MATLKHVQVFPVRSHTRDYLDYLDVRYLTIRLLSLGKRTHDRWLGTHGRARCGLTAKIGNQVGGPGDYMPTERLAADSPAEHSFWVYNKAGVVTPLSAWARHNCGALDRLD